jgi:hypothetical protein
VLASARPFLTLAALLSLAACTGAEAPEGGAPAGDGAKAGKAKAKAEAPAYVPLQQAIEGAPAPAILLSQAWFLKDANGKPKPGPARLQVWRKGADGWQATLLEDGESNVFHKALATDAGLLTIAGEKAMLKRWSHTAGAWSAETLWSKSWGGKFNRLRDIEVGDVDADGKDEWVVATHDGGVIAVINPGENGAAPEVIELDAKPDTFVHEIEIGDIDGDGKKEFFATPSDRNQANASQAGEIVAYRWDGTTYTRSLVDGGAETHAKEVLATDLNGDGKAELFGVLEAETDAAKQVKTPVRIRQYTPQPDGTFAHTDIATINDRQTRFLVAGDFDGDGQTELVAAAMKTGLYLLDPSTDAKGVTTWASTVIDPVSSGFEHATIAADVDGDGRPELIVAADDQRELKLYRWDSEKKAFAKELIGRLQGDTITWNIAFTTL